MTRETIDSRLSVPECAARLRAATQPWPLFGYRWSNVPGVGGWVRDDHFVFRGLPTFTRAPVMEASGTLAPSGSGTRVEVDYHVAWVAYFPSIAINAGILAAVLAVPALLAAQYSLILAVPALLAAQYSLAAVPVIVLFVGLLFGLFALVQLALALYLAWRFGERDVRALRDALRSSVNPQT